MPKYTVVALEKFIVRTTYEDVEARSHGEAERLVREGKVAYDHHAIQEGDEEFIEFESVDETDA